MLLRNTRRLAALLAVALLPLPSAGAAAAAPAPAAAQAPTWATARSDAHVPGRLVVQYVGADAPTVVDTPEAAVPDTLRALRHDPGVAWVERDVVVHAQQAVAPNDPYWPDQWGARQVAADDAWRTTVGDPTVTVAVLDTGIDRTHEDLGSGTVTGWNVLEGSTDTDDDHGHGTAAAGVLAARTDNGRGVAGVCWTCEIMPVTVLADDGSGMMSDLAEGIRWATDNGADVISMSVAGTSSTRALESAVGYAAEKGVVLVASAGNHGTTDPTYPAGLPEVIGVAASDRNDDRYDFSGHGSWVDVAAPGCNPSVQAGVRGGGYAQFCGTSSAAPLVAGVLALARAAAPEAGAAGVADALAQGAAAVGSWVAHGRVDAAGTLSALTDAPPAAEPSPEPTPTPEPSPEPSPAPVVTAGRVAGDSRFSTAAAISQAAHAPGVPRVYVGTGRSYPDALAAGPAAARAGGPVLLTERDHLPAATAAELDRLRPAEIVVAGGTAAVSTTVERALARYAPVRRLAGPDRYTTAAAIARDAFPGTATTVFLASGRNFPDALAGGAAAAAAQAPLLLTEPDRLPGATRAALDALRPERIILLGGTSAVGSAVSGLLGGLVGTVSRVSGTDRFATSGAIARLVAPSTTDVVYLATGNDFPDALAGGPLAATSSSPLLLVSPRSLPAAAAAELARMRPRRVVALGGRAAVSDATLAAARTAAAGG